MERWNGVKVYEEANFDRKLRGEKKSHLWEETTGGEGNVRDALLRDQLLDLIDGLDISPRSKDLLRLRLDGCTLREIADRLDISRQRVERVWSRLMKTLPQTLAGFEERMIPGKIPHYGWQEVYLDSLRQ